MRKESPPKGSSRRGGYRENAGRKPIWIHQETCTIRIPKIWASKVLELAHVLDINQKFDRVKLSNSSGSDLVTKSIDQDKYGFPNAAERQDAITNFDDDTESKINSLLEEQVVSLNVENGTESKTSTTDKVTESKIIQTSLSLAEALVQSKQVLKSKKSASSASARLLTKLYSAPVSFEYLK